MFARRTRARAHARLIDATIPADGRMRFGARSFASRAFNRLHTLPRFGIIEAIFNSKFASADAFQLAFAFWNHI